MSHNASDGTVNGNTGVVIIVVIASLVVMALIIACGGWIVWQVMQPIGGW